MSKETNSIAAFVNPFFCQVNIEDSRTKSKLDLDTDLFFNVNIGRFTLDIQTRLKNYNWII